MFVSTFFSGISVGGCRKADTKLMERKYACPNCEARFPFPNKLRLHINSHHSLANHCELCPERFNRFNELRTHMRYAHQIIHKCHLCGYSSSVKAEVKKHIVRWHENGVHCTIDGCEATVAYNRLRRHIREVHCKLDPRRVDLAAKELMNGTAKFSGTVSGDSPDMICSSLTETSDATNTAKKHINNEDCQSETHDYLPASPQNTKTLVNQSFEANKEVVSGGFDSGDGGNDNFEETEKMNNFENAAFTQSLDTPDQIDEMLTEQTSSAEVPFFTYAEIGEYVCHKCGKVFGKIRNARRHWNRVHSKIFEKTVRQKNHVCNFPSCSKQYPCLSKLQDHIAAAHGKEIPFTCETCNRRFRSRGRFAVHLRRYHLVSIRDVPSGFINEAGDLSA